MEELQCKDTANTSLAAAFGLPNPKVAEGSFYVQM
jgi:hypothetical protein